MSAFVIAVKSTEQLETIVFAGEGGDAVVVFSNLVKAEKYVKDAGWDQTYTVASLEPVDFVEWLLKCRQSGIKRIAIDPTRTGQESGLQMNTLDIETQLDGAGRQIIQTANSSF